MTAWGSSSVETTTGPVAVGGRTINLVARTRAITLGSDPERVVAAWSRPVHVEVLDADGRCEIVKVRDYQLVATAVVACAAIAWVACARMTGARR